VCLRGIGEQDLALWLFAHCSRPCSGHYPGAQAQISIVRRPRAPQRSRPKRTILSNDTTLLDLPSQRRTHIRRDRGFRSKVILPHVKAYMFLEDYAKREVRVIDPPAAFRWISRTWCSLSSCWNCTDTYISRPCRLRLGGIRFSATSRFSHFLTFIFSRRISFTLVPPSYGGPGSPSPCNLSLRLKSWQNAPLSLRKENVFHSNPSSRDSSPVHPSNHAVFHVCAWQCISHQRRDSVSQKGAGRCGLCHPESRCWLVRNRKRFKDIPFAMPYLERSLQSTTREPRGSLHRSSLAVMNQRPHQVPMRLVSNLPTPIAHHQAG
jgi:hypothetical protein